LAAAVGREELETAGGQQGEKDNVPHGRENRPDTVEAQLGHSLAPHSVTDFLSATVADRDHYNYNDFYFRWHLKRSTRRSIPTDLKEIIAAHNYPPLDL
jgi:hypothetical protein